MSELAPTAPGASLAELRVIAEGELSGSAPAARVLVDSGELRKVLDELDRLQAVESRLKWLATKPDRTKAVGEWYGNEIDAVLNARPKRTRPRAELHVAPSP